MSEDERIFAAQRKTERATLERAAKIAETYYMHHPEGREAWAWCRDIAVAIRSAKLRL